MEWSRQERISIWTITFKSSEFRWSLRVCRLKHSGHLVVKKNWQFGERPKFARSSCRGFVAQWLERPTGNRKTRVRSPAGLRCVFFVWSSCQFTFASRTLLPLFGSWTAASSGWRHHLRGDLNTQWRETRRQQETRPTPEIASSWTAALTTPMMWEGDDSEKFRKKQNVLFFQANVVCAQPGRSVDTTPTVNE